MKLKLFLATLLGSLAFTSFRAEAAGAQMGFSDVPPPVPGYPISWCIRARTNAFLDAKLAGMEYVELALQDVYPPADADFVKFVAEVESYGLRVLGGYNPFPPDVRLVGTNVDQGKIDMYLNRLMPRAKALKMKYIVFNAGRSWRVPDGFSRDEAFQQLVSVSRRFAEESSKHGLTVLIEPMRGADSNMITNVAEAVVLVDAVKHPNFQMMVDYSFLTIQKEDPKVLLAAGDRLKHVHISNPANNRNYPMADSESDYAAFFKALKEIKYKGALSIHAGTTNFGADAPRAMTFLRAKAKELASGQ